MALALLRPDHLKRYKDIVALLIKYGRSDLVKEAGLSTPAIRRESLAIIGKEPPPEELASDLE
ncbi:MAG: ABC transporter, partial [Acidobacteria bacterium]